jgi:RNA polymerase primary sigma factor
MRQLKITKQVTNRETASFDKYLSEIGKIEMITIDEEVSLAQKIKKGDKQALDKLTEANLRFVVSVSKQYQNQGLSLPDLINEGNLGMIKAAKRFDETRGFKFISYAVWWIRQSILQALAEQSRVVKIPLNMVGGISRINKASSQLEQMYGREPSLSEIADSLEMSEEKVEEFLNNSKRHVSMDAPIYRDEEEGNMYDLLPSVDLVNLKDNTHDYDSIKKHLEKAIKDLPDQEGEIIIMDAGIFGQEKLNYEQIAEETGLSISTIGTRLKKGMRRLKRDPDLFELFKNL